MSIMIAGERLDRIHVHNQGKIFIPACEAAQSGDSLKFPILYVPAPVTSAEIFGNDQVEESDLTQYSHLNQLPHLRPKPEVYRDGISAAVWNHYCANLYGALAIFRQNSYFDRRINCQQASHQFTISDYSYHKQITLSNPNTFAIEKSIVIDRHGNLSIGFQTKFSSSVLKSTQLHFTPGRDGTLLVTSEELFWDKAGDLKKSYWTVYVDAQGKSRTYQTIFKDRENFDSYVDPLAYKAPLEDPWFMHPYEIVITSA